METLCCKEKHNTRNFQFAVTPRLARRQPCLRQHPEPGWQVSNVDWGIWSRLYDSRFKVSNVDWGRSTVPQLSRADGRGEDRTQIPFHGRLGRNHPPGKLNRSAEESLSSGMQTGEKCSYYQADRSNYWQTGEKCNGGEMQQGRNADMGGMQQLPSRQDQLLTGEKCNWGEMQTGEKFNWGEMQLLAKQTGATIGRRGRNATGEKCRQGKMQQRNQTLGSWAKYIYFLCFIGGNWNGAADAKSFTNPMTRGQTIGGSIWTRRTWHEPPKCFHVDKSSQI